jgi:hypothetical protein
VEREREDVWGWKEKKASCDTNRHRMQMMEDTRWAHHSLCPSLVFLFLCCSTASPTASRTPPPAVLPTTLPSFLFHTTRSKRTTLVKSVGCESAESDSDSSVQGDSSRCQLSMSSASVVPDHIPLS